MSALTSPSKSPATVAPMTEKRALEPRFCPSGLMTSTLIAPGVAVLVLMLAWMCVGSIRVTEFTVTPPVNDTASRLANPAPGSKKPDPPLDVPVIVITVLGVLGTLVGETDTGVAGGGASSF